MEAAFSVTEFFEQRDTIPIEKKIAIWEDFLENYTKDNPDSTRDEELRKLAKERLTFWKASTDLSE
jgi:hypothetical protein